MTRWGRALEYFKRNWNTALAATSVIGYIVLSSIAPLRQYVSFFVFLAVNAVVWTLVEIKLRLFEHTTPNIYTSMRHARSDISGALRACANRRHSATTDIVIIGGRIRTISDIVREFKNEVLDENSTARNLRLRIYCVHPDFFASWIMPDGTGSARNARYARLVEQLGAELMTYNSLPELTERSITVDVIYYRCFPAVYAFVIGDKAVFWGFFTWNHATQDFDGPENPCFRLTPNHPDFDKFRRWLLSRSTFYDTLAGTAVSEFVAS